MKTSVVMTVHDREPEVLLASLRSLYRCGLAGCELVIVNDRSEMDYSWTRDYITRFDAGKWVNTGPYEGFRVGNYYGNPAKAFNIGLDAASGERVIIMSSDVIVTPAAVASMEKFSNPECLYTPRVIDLDSGAEYCGSSRFWPMPWFLAVPRQAALDVGGWDEAYLDGLCYEDNDFVGKLALKLGRIRCDWEAVVYHQSHDQPAYNFNDPEVEKANQRNRDLTKRKWGGVPFEAELGVFDMKRRPDPAGCHVWTMKDDGMLARVLEIERTARASV